MCLANKKSRSHYPEAVTLEQHVMESSMALDNHLHLSNYAHAGQPAHTYKIMLRHRVDAWNEMLRMPDSTAPLMSHTLLRSCLFHSFRSFLGSTFCVTESVQAGVNPNAANRWGQT